MKLQVFVISGMGNPFMDLAFTIDIFCSSFHITLQRHVVKFVGILGARLQTSQLRCKLHNHCELDK